MLDMNKLNQICVKMIAAHQKDAQVDGISIHISTAEACKVNTSRY